MRAPITGTGPQRMSSIAVSVTAEAFEQQPDAGSTPLATLPVTSGSFSDDAAQMTQRSMTLNLAFAPTWLQPGMWVRVSIGVRQTAPIRYRLPTMIITDITADLSTMGGAALVLADPSAVLDGRPWENDQSLYGTLQSLVGGQCSTCLTRVTDASGVPALSIPAGMVAEFGEGRWAVCVKVADALGVALHFNDAGDPIGRLRSSAVPSPVAAVERALSPGGTRHQARVPTSAVVLVSRSNDAAPLTGRAATTASVPPWYLPYVAADRQQGDVSMSQADADQLARDLLNARLTDLQVFDGLSILPAPFLEAGVDVVTLDAVEYYVRAVTLDVPSLATTVTLRKATP